MPTDRRPVPRGLVVVGLAAVAALYLALFPGVLLRGEVLTGRDLSLLHRPLLSRLVPFAQASGGLPLWNPLANFGQPYAANPGIHLFHPFTALYFLFPFEVAFGLPLLLAPLLAAAGMWFLLRELGRSRPAALFGALGWGLGGYLLSCLTTLPTLFGALALPPAMAFAARLARRPGRGAIVGLAVTFGLVLVAAEPTLWIVSPFLIALAAVEALPSESGCLPGTGRVAQVGVRLLAPLLLGFLLGAATLLPGFALARRSGRGAPLSADEAADWSSPPVRVAELVFPRALGHRTSPDHPWSWGGSLYPRRGEPYFRSVYPGLAVALLALAAAAALPRRSAPWAITAAGGLGLALGSYTPLWSLARTLPIVDRLRYPEKFWVLPLLVAVVLAAGGIDLLRAGDPRFRRRLRTILAVTAATAAAATLLALAFDPAPLVHPGPSPGGPWPAPDGGAIARDLAGTTLVAAALLAIFLLHGRLGPRRTVIALLLLLPLDLLAVRPPLVTVPSAELHTPPPVLADLLAQGVHGPILNTVAWSQKVDAVRHIAPAPVPAQWEIASGYERDFDLTELVWSKRATSLFWKTILEDPRRMEPLLRRRGFEAVVSLRRSAGPGTTSSGSWDLFGVTRVRAPRPFAFCAETVVPVRGEAGWLEAVAALGPRVEGAALVEPEDAARLPLAPSPGRVTVVERRPTRLALDVDVAGPASALVAVNQTWDTGWRADIDGNPAPLLRVDLSLSGVAVPPGRHRVSLSYLDASLAAGVATSLLGIVATLAVLLWPRERNG